LVSEKTGDPQHHAVKKEDVDRSEFHNRKNYSKFISGYEVTILKERLIYRFGCADFRAIGL
jgi:hypothetical protein